MSNGTTEPSRALRALEVTQVASLTFYILPIVIALYGYDLRSGLGQLPDSLLQQVAADKWARILFKSCLGLIIGFNAFRYFWSAFLVESLESFHRVRGTLKICYQGTEWFLRLACMSVLFIIPISLSFHAHLFEALLVLLFALLLIWDGIMYRLPKFQSEDDTKFKKSVGIWFWIELCGLLASGFYLAVVLYLAPASTDAAGIAIGLLSAAFVGFGVADVAIHGTQYLDSVKRLFKSMIIGTIVAGVLIWFVKPIANTMEGLNGNACSCFSAAVGTRSCSSDTQLRD